MIKITDNVEREVYEKMVMARALQECSPKDRDGEYKLNFKDTISMFMTVANMDTAAYTWVKWFLSLGKYEEHTIFLLEEVLNLPVCPQPWRGDVSTPESEKLKDSKYYDYKQQYDNIVKEYLLKYRELWERKIATMESRGKVKMVDIVIDRYNLNDNGPVNIEALENNSNKLSTSNAF